VKIGRYLIIFLLLMGLLITFGNRGLIDNYLMSSKLAELEAQNAKITVENNELRRKIIMLRDDLSFVEHIARSELGMVKEGEFVYRLTN